MPNVQWYARHSTTFLVSAGLQLASDAQVAWSNTAGDPGATLDLFLLRDGANIFAQANSTTAQIFRLYNTRASAGSGDWLSLDWGVIAGNAVGIMSRAGGAGTARNLYVGTEGTAVLTFQTGSTDRWRIDASGNLFALTDRAVDIGAANATRPRSIYTASYFVVASSQANPTIATHLTAGSRDEIAFYSRNQKLVFAYNFGGTVNYLSIPLNGTTATWTNSSTEP